MRHLGPAAAVIVACFAMMGCEKTSIATSKQLIEKTLKDPGSIQYRNLHTCGDKDQWAWGEFNSKNSYGGYDGFKPFVFDGERVHIAGDGTTAPTYLCDGHDKPA